MDVEAHNASWSSIKRPCTGREFNIELIMTLMCVAALRQSLSESMRLISINWDDLLCYSTLAVAESTRARRKIEIWKVSQHRRLPAEFTTVAHTFKLRLRSNKHCSRGHSLSSYGHLSNVFLWPVSRDSMRKWVDLFCLWSGSSPGSLFIRTAGQIIVHRETDRHNKRLWTSPLFNRHYRTLLLLNGHFL